MKTHVFFLILAIFMAITTGVNAQTKQQLKSVQKIEREISQLRGQLASVNGQIARESIVPDSTMWHRERVRLDTLIAQGNASLPTLDSWRKQRTSVLRRLADMKAEAISQNQLVAGLTPKRDALSKRIQKLEADRDALMDVSISEAITQKTPQELSNREVKLRTNSNFVENQELDLDFKAATQQMALDKKNAAPVVADPVKGYFGKVINLSQYTIYSFVVFETGSKIERKVFTLNPGMTEGDYFLPGKYTCQVKAYGEVIATYSFVINSDTHNVFGEDLHWAVWQQIDVRRPMARNLK